MLMCALWAEPLPTYVLAYLASGIHLLAQLPQGLHAIIMLCSIHAIGSGSSDMGTGVLLCFSFRCQCYCRVLLAACTP